MCYKNKKALTIVELLTVLAVMAILVSLLLPAVTQINIMAKETRQKAQFVTIGIGLETFRNDFVDYPESRYNNATDYSGAQILSEAMVGYDLFGVHPDTEFRSDGQWNSGADEYEPDPTASNYNGNERKGPYIEVEKIPPILLDDLYNTTNPDGLAGNTYVLTDTFKRTYSHLDQKFGMPILYYKAKSNKIEHNTSGGTNNIFDFLHNNSISENLNAPWDTSKPQELGDNKFYSNEYIANKNFQNPSASSNYLPYNKDSYILISAGRDGLYGTDDDIFNFDK